MSLELQVTDVGLHQHVHDAVLDTVVAAAEHKLSAGLLSMLAVLVLAGEAAVLLMPASYHARPHSDMVTQQLHLLDTASASHVMCQQQEPLAEASAADLPAGFAVVEMAVDTPVSSPVSRIGRQHSLWSPDVRVVVCLHPRDELAA